MIFFQLLVLFVFACRCFFFAKCRWIKASLEALKQHVTSAGSSKQNLPKVTPLCRTTAVTMNWTPQQDICVYVKYTPQRCYHRTWLSNSWVRGASPRRLDVSGQRQYTLRYSATELANGWSGAKTNRGDRSRQWKSSLVLH